MPVAPGILCCPGKDECRVRMDALERPSRDTSTSLDCLFRTQSTSSISATAPALPYLPTSLWVAWSRVRR